MNRLRNFIDGGCCFATVLTLTAIALSCTVVGVLVWQDATSSASASAPTPTSTCAPASAFSPLLTPTSTPIPKPPLPLRVLNVAPEDGSEDVRSLTAIKVTFNQPMVALQAAVDPDQFPVPIVIRPEIDGRGEWIDADVYQFRPDSLDEATHYTVTVPAGVASLQGATLEDEYVFAFSTARPKVRSIEPRADAQSVDPRGEVRIHFSTEMDRRSVESRFSLVDADDQPVEGAFHWPDDRTMIFWPDDPLPRSARYRAALTDGARAEGKELGTVEELAWQFEVAGLPHILSSTPADGDLSAHPNGKLVLRFNVPMDIESVEEALQIEPEPEYVDIEWEGDNTRLEAYVDFDPSAEYRILLAEGATDRYGEPLTGNRSIVFRSAPLDSMLSLYAPYDYYQGPVGSYVADQAVEQFIEVRNLEAVTFTLSSVDSTDFMNVYHDPYEMPDTKDITRTLLHTWTQSLDLPLNRIKYVSTTVAGSDGQLPPGVYLLEVRAERMYDTRFMVVSRANLALKWGPRQVFVWATDVISGQVIPDMDIAVYRHNGTLLAEGVTDGDGVFMAEIENLTGEYWYRWEETLFAVGDGSQGLALCSSRWNKGITSWDFGMRQDEGEDGASAAYIYSDRPIYRPGQTVYFKSIVREDDDGRYSLLDQETVPVSILDSQGNELFADELPLTEFGTIHGELELTESAPLGRYTVQADLPGRSEPERLYFTVAEYRKPEFEVEVSADRAYAIHGESITVTVQADYYFGQPVPDAEVSWRLYGSPYRFSLPGVWYSFGEYTDHWWYYGEDRRDTGQMVYASGEGRTDENGQLALNFPVDLSQSEVSQVFVIEASLTDINDQEVTGSTLVVAHKTDTYLGVRPRRYVGAPDLPQEIDIVALDPLKEPRAGIPVTVDFYNVRWDTVREKTDSGSYVWRNTRTEELVESFVVTTTASGEAQTVVTPTQGGEYKVVVRALDGLGNEAVSNTYLWVWDEGYINWGVHNHDRIQLVTDKREYEPGDVAEILITAPFADCLALVTVERGGVLSYEVQQLHGTSGLIQVPIVADYAPNAFVSVSLLKGQADKLHPGGFPAPVFKLGYAELRVALREQQLNVTITPDKERYQPGDTAAYTIRATDHRGRGVSAEMSVGVVDAAVLALLGDNADPILDAFYHTRGLAVWNAQTLVISIERLNEKLEKAGKGGGGGGEAEGSDIRRFFRDTAFWDPVIITNQNGWATVRVPLPDDLTTWRLRAKAVTADTRVGDDSADVIATKELLVRPVLPRFFTVGDEATVAALVHNYTGVTQTVQFEMRGEGLEMPGGPVTDTSFIIAPGKAEKVAWTVTIPKVKETKVLFTARAVDAAASDAVEMKLPVHAFAETIAIAANEPVPKDEQLSVGVELPDDVDEMDEIIIETIPSLAAGIRQGLEYLTGYPYG